MRKLIDFFMYVMLPVLTYFFGVYVGGHIEERDHTCPKDTVYNSIMMTPEQIDLFNKPDFESYIKDTAYQRWIRDHYLRNKFKDK